MAGGETTTPNIGLQIPGFDQANWQVPTNYNWNLLDHIFGGEIQVPALSVVTLTAVNFELPSVVAAIATAFYVDAPALVSGATYQFTYIPIVMFGVYVNGVWQRPSVDYTLAGNQITLTYTLSSGDSLYATYLH